MLDTLLKTKIKNATVSTRDKYVNISLFLTTWKESWILPPCFDASHTSRSVILSKYCELEGSCDKRPGGKSWESTLPVDVEDIYQSNWAITSVKRGSLELKEVVRQNLITFVQSLWKKKSQSLVSRSSDLCFVPSHPLWCDAFGTEKIVLSYIHWSESFWS